MPTLRVAHLTKRFPRVLAVDDVTIDFFPGHVHAVVGENGAGKTTLMNLIYGVHQPDSGTIAVEGRPVTIRRPADAINEGIALVHQHFKLVPSFTVADNMMMIEHRKVGLVPDQRAFAKRIVSIGRTYGLEVDPNARVRDLPLGIRQRVEILAGLLRDARLLILDEPTTVLAPPEVTGLFQTLKRIAQEGRSVVLITHKLAEVFEVADMFSVMRRGKLVRSGRTADSSPGEVATVMVGRDPDALRAPHPGRRKPGDVALRVADVSVPAEEGSPGLSGVAFDVHDGEILAVVGVEGNGQTELIEVLSGLRTPASGRIWIGDVDVTGASRRRTAELGLGVIPEDRHAEGLVLPMTVAENLSLDRIREPGFSRRGIWLRAARIRKFVQGAIRDFHIQAASIGVPVRTLSGGNQQKIVLARALLSDPRVLIAAQPARGLDVAATRYVLDQLVAARANNSAVLLFSSDLDHVFSLADRVLVLFKGHVAASLDTRTATRDDLGRYMAGVEPVASSVARAEVRANRGEIDTDG
jgi:simple sugar transport system ATP-binding protein